MKLVYKMILVFGVVAALAGLECILNCSCNLVAYPVPEPLLLQDNTKPQAKLTLMIYMAADNDLESYALQNLKQMERADFSRMNVLVLLDRSEEYDETNDNWTDTRLFEVTHDSTNGSGITSIRLDCPPLGLSADTTTELDMGNYNNLKTFVEFAKSNYKAEQYALILWGHGTGWRAFAIDDKSNSYISVKELGLALKEQQLSVIGFDTCFGGAFEALYELKDCAQFIIGSPGLTPASGWDYKSLLQELSGGDFSPQETSAAMSHAILAEKTIIQTNELQPLLNNIEAFSKALARTITDEAARRSVLDILLNTKSYCYTQYPSDLFIDLFSMAQAFLNSTDEQLQAAALELSQATASKRIGIYFMPKTGEGTLAVTHPQAYIKNNSDQTQCAFIKQSNWWVPVKNGNSESLLDKLFYCSF